MAELLTDRRLEWTEIDGWLTVSEGRVLQSLAMGRRVLELGSYKGRSTVCMAEVASEVYSVDHHRGDANTGHAKTHTQFTENLCAAAVDSRVVIDVVRLEDFALPRGHYGAFDLAYVDVEHSQQTTYLALEIAMHAVKDGGVIAWHDADRVEVRAAVATAGLVPAASVDSLEWCTI